LSESKKKKNKKKKRERQKGSERRAGGGDVQLPFELALERGDYAAARRLARAALDGDDGARARAVLDRVKVDSFPLLVFGACLILISTVAYCGLG
jgi:hypothetical protein